MFLGFLFQGKLLLTGGGVSNPQTDFLNAFLSEYSNVVQPVDLNDLKILKYPLKQDFQLLNQLWTMKRSKGM